MPSGSLFGLYKAQRGEPEGGKGGKTSFALSCPLSLLGEWVVRCVPVVYPLWFCPFGCPEGKATYEPSVHRLLPQRGKEANRRGTTTKLLSPSGRKPKGQNHRGTTTISFAVCFQRGNLQQSKPKGIKQAIDKPLLGRAENYIINYNKSECNDLVFAKQVVPP